MPYYGTTDAMPARPMDDVSSSSSSTEFTAPFQAFRPPLFTGGSPEDNNTTDDTSPRNDETLPSLPHNQSWIGARVSPIPSRIDEEEAENNADANGKNTKTNSANAAPQPSQQQPKNNPSQFFFPFARQLPRQRHGTIATERSSLLPQQQPPKLETTGMFLHPLTDSLHTPNYYHQHNQYYNTTTNISDNKSFRAVGPVVCLVAGLELVGMAVYDAVNQSTNALWWPWGRPSLAARLAAGALVPAWILEDNTTTTEQTTTALSWWSWTSPISWLVQYGRMITSAVQCTSVVEYLVVVAAWWWWCSGSSTLKTASNTNKNWDVGVVYVLCVITGQLWMMATYQSETTMHSRYNSNQDDRILAASCAAWGTCAVLCWTGMKHPNQRCGCFVLCSILVVVTLVQQLVGEPSNNDIMPLVLGCIASTFWGWALYGAIMGTTSHSSVTTTSSSRHYASLGMAAKRRDQLPLPGYDSYTYERLVPTKTSATPIRPGVWLLCAIAVVALWVVPLLRLSYEW